jgi:hypothetical protein
VLYWVESCIEEVVGTRGRVNSFVGVVMVDVSLPSLGIDADN